MIRKIEPKDREIYIKLALKFYSSDAVNHSIPKKYIEDSFDEMMRSDVYLNGYIIEHEGKIVGYALISKTFSCEGGGLTVWIEEAFVLSEYRSLGLGGELFSSLERIYGCELARMRLEVTPDNERAKSLYRRLGFDVLPYRQMVKEFN